MGLLRGKSHWLLFVCFLVSMIATAGVGVWAAIEGLSVLGSVPLVAEGEFILIVMAIEALPQLVLLGVLGVVDVLLLVGTLAAALRATSMPKSDRLASLAQKLEQKYPALEILDVSDRVEPGDEHRREKLKEKYVNGEISEAEFERRVGDYVDDGDHDPMLNELEEDHSKDRNVEYES